MKTTGEKIVIAIWTDYFGGISLRECPPGSPPWWSEQMAINLKTNRTHANSGEVLRKWAERWCRRHGRSVHGFGHMDIPCGVWAKVYPTDPRPAYRAFVELAATRQKRSPREGK